MEGMNNSTDFGILLQTLFKKTFFRTLKKEEYSLTVCITVVNFKWFDHHIYVLKHLSLTIIYYKKKLLAYVFKNLFFTLPIKVQPV
jgi:hypothetical protein